MTALAGFLFTLGFIIWVFYKIFAAIPLIYNGKLEPVWRSIPRIWKESNTWSDFIHKCNEQDKKQINIIFFS